MKYAQNVTELIGKTPLVRLKRASANETIVLGKCEFLNPTHSVKDRIGYSMIQDALKDNLINHETTIIEPTSGNTGMGLAAVCAAEGLKLILTMPASMSEGRRRTLAVLGAELVLTDALLGMQGSIDKAVEIFSMTENAYIPLQFANRANPQAHREGTAPEIWEDTRGRVDIFVTGVGTGGTITGVGEVLKKQNPDIQIVAVEPASSSVLSGEDAAPHVIHGIGMGFVPDVLNKEIYDEIITVSDADALATSRALAKEEGLLVGISSGANAHAASLLASREENQGKVIVTMLCDTGERYLTSALYQNP